MIIDAHAHAAGDYSTVDKIRAITSRFNIEKVILCTSPKNNLDLKEPPNFPFLKSPESIFFLNRMMRFAYKSFKDMGDGNKTVADLHKGAADIVIPFLWVNPLDSAHLENMERNIQEYGARGIKLHQAWDPFSIDGKEFKFIVDTARRNNLPVFIHLYSRAETHKLAEMALKEAGVTFIVGHMLGLDIFATNRAYKANIYFDTSGSERVRGEDISKAINLFGDDHVVFGTDSPYAGIANQIQKIDRLAISDNAKENIFRSNIKNLLSL